MWRNGRRNGLKIRWAVTGPCRFESGHRQFDCGLGISQKLIKDKDGERFC